MTYYEPSEWDEDSIEVEKYEEEAGESVLRSEIEKKESKKFTDITKI